MKQAMVSNRKCRDSQEDKVLFPVGIRAKKSLQVGIVAIIAAALIPLKFSDLILTRGASKRDVLILGNPRAWIQLWQPLFRLPPVQTPSWYGLGFEFAALLDRQPQTTPNFHDLSIRLCDSPLQAYRPYRALHTPVKPRIFPLALLQMHLSPSFNRNASHKRNLPMVEPA